LGAAAWICDWNAAQTNKYQDIAEGAIIDNKMQKKTQNRNKNLNMYRNMTTAAE
jgi:hypothetical protein